MKNGIIEIESEGLEAELEKVLWNIIKKAQVKAHEEGFKELMDYDIFDNNKDKKFKGPHNWGLWLRVAPDYKCWICGYKTGNNLNNWYCDANGNIIHKHCYHTVMK